MAGGIKTRALELEKSVEGLAVVRSALDSSTGGGETAAEGSAGVSDVWLGVAGVIADGRLARLLSRSDCREDVG
eukprot:2268211-Pyramimonas_sp.AAC.1